MGRRADFGVSWPDVVATWCLGTALDVPGEEAWEALGVLEHLWPERLDQVLRGSAKGLGAMLPLIDLGLSLAACQNLTGFDHVFGRLKEGEDAALSEIKVAAALANLGYRLLLEPFLEGKRLDALVLVDENEVYVEVASPELSDAMKEAYAGMAALADRLAEESSGTCIDVHLVTEPTRDVLESVVEFIKTSTPSSTEVVCELPGVAFIRHQMFSENRSSFQPVPISAGRPVLFTEHIGKRIGADVETHVSVNLPLSDGRAERLITAEIHHFSPKESNILVLDVTKVPDGIRSWTPLVERRFQPGRNRRLGAVVLFSDGIFKAGILQMWSVLRNPYAYRPPPEPLLNGIASLNQSGQLFESRRH